MSNDMQEGILKAMQMKERVGVLEERLKLKDEYETGAIDY